MAGYICGCQCAFKFVKIFLTVYAFLWHFVSSYSITFTINITCILHFSFLSKMWVSHAQFLQRRSFAYGTTFFVGRGVGVWGVGVGVVGWDGHFWQTKGGCISLPHPSHTPVWLGCLQEQIDWSSFFRLLTQICKPVGDTRNGIRNHWWQKIKTSQILQNS